MTTFEQQLKDSLSHAYEIERELGGGGMSRVFVATDRSLGRKVVIKLLSPELIAEVNRGRFRREIQVAAQLQHPHIVTLLSAGEDGDLVYYTMPFIQGESLKSDLEKNGPLSIADCIRVLYDVVDALAYAHAQGVVHRDIKPANILRSGAHSLVTDFGVAKALNAAMPSSAMTSTGMAIGTPAYMAPEQLAGDPAADHRIDIYAVGLLAYELLTGTSPYAAGTPQAVLAAVLTRDPKPINEVRKEVPRKLAAIIMQCLSKIPGGRPPTAQALLSALDMIATASGEIRTKEHKVPKDRTKPLPVAPVVVDEAEGYEKKKSRGPLVLAGIAALLVLGVAGYMLSRNNGSKAAIGIEPASPAFAETSPKVSAAEAAKAAAVAAAPPVITKVDSAAIAEAVRKQLAQASSLKSAGQPVINADSLRKALLKHVSDSIAKVNTQRAAIAAAAAAAQPAPAPAAPVAAAPAAPAAVAAAAPPVSNGKRRIAITEPRVSSANPLLNTFSRSLIDALRVQLDQGESFAVVDQDSVHDAMTRGGSRDEAAKILKPDIMVSPNYVGSGDTVNIVVTVWDMRRTSSYGIRVTSSKLVASRADAYLGPIVQSVLKQLEDLPKETTIYTKH